MKTPLLLRMKLRRRRETEHSSNHTMLSHCNVNCLQILGYVPDSVYVPELGNLELWDIFDHLVVNPMKSAITVDWRDFLPLLKWLPNPVFEKQVVDVEKVRCFVVRALIEQKRRRLELQVCTYARSSRYCCSDPHPSSLSEWAVRMVSFVLLSLIHLDSPWFVGWTSRISPGPPSTIYPCGLYALACCSCSIDLVSRFPADHSTTILRLNAVS